MLLPTIVQGAMGLVSGGAQIFGHEIRAIFDAFEAGENEKAKETFEPLLPFLQEYRSEWPYSSELDYASGNRSSIWNQTWKCKTAIGTADG